MRWFKHFADAHTHPDHLRLIERFGMAGYGMYWKVVEMIAYSGEGKFSLTLSEKLWARSLTIRGKLLHNFLNLQKEIGNFSVFCSGDQITVEIPNLSKYNDRWTQAKLAKARKTGQQLASDCPEAGLLEVEVEVEVEGSQSTDSLSEKLSTVSPPVAASRKKKKKCSATTKATVADSPPATDFPTFPTQAEEWRLPLHLYSELTQTYRNLPVRGLILEARQWLLANPQRLKTPLGMSRFIQGWVSREAERARMRGEDPFGESTRACNREELLDMLPTPEESAAFTRYVEDVRSRPAPAASPEVQERVLAMLGLGGGDSPLPEPQSGRLGPFPPEIEGV